MKTFFAVGLAVIFSISGSHAALTTYYGPDYDQANGTIGSAAVNGGKLTLNNNNNSVSATFTKGSGSFADILVIFIDSVPGGFTDTRGFADTSGALPIAISGFDGTHRAIANFATGFAADYAIAIGGDQGARVYLLAEGAGGFG